MIKLKELMTRKGLDNRRRKHEKETGLAYFYELYIIENEIMAQEFAGKTYIGISCKDIFKQLKKTDRKPTYSKKQLKEEISKHLDVGGYKWFYKFGKFTIIVNESIIYDNKLRVTYKDWFFVNTSVLLCNILPLVIYFNYTEKNLFINIVGKLSLLVVFITLLEMLVDAVKYVKGLVVYKKYVKLIRGI